MVAIGEDAVLSYELENDRPVELLDLTASLSALGNEYVHFCGKDSEVVTTEDVRLYIDSVSKGSIIATLACGAPEATFQFVNNAQSILSFASHLDGVFAYLKNLSRPEPETVDQTTLENSVQILEPVANDNGSVLNLVANEGGQIAINIGVNSLQANAMQNSAAKAIARLKDRAVSHRDRAVLRWYQARNDPTSRSGDRAIIESIWPSAVKTVVMSAEEKEQALGGIENPFLKPQIVDVEIERVNGKPVLYKITKFHGQIETEGLDL